MTAQATFIELLLVAALAPHALLASPLPNDASTLLLLQADSTMVGASGEVPAVLTGVTYETGVIGKAVRINSTDRVLYGATGNMVAQRGTLEFWLRPAWNGNDGISHLALTWGSFGGLLMGKDGANNWRIIVNRFQTERGAAVNVSDWLANAWHHCAFTWDSAFVRVYVDGVERASSAVGFVPPAISTTQFQLGGEGTAQPIDGLLDEIRISDRVRSASEIQADFLSGVEVSAIAIQPDTITQFVTWRTTPTVWGTAAWGTVSLPPDTLTWNSTDPAIATVDSIGRIVSTGPGTAVVRGTFGASTDSIVVTSMAPVLGAQEVTPDPWLTIPAAGAQFDMPVLVIRYFPTLDGVNLDPSTTGESGSIESKRGWTDVLDRRVKFMLEEGSRFHGYKVPGAPPSLGYRIVGIIDVFEPMPRGASLGSGVYYPDYDQIVSRFDGRHWVEDLGVKEIWLWGYHYGDIAPAESNMSSPTTGDISNSYRLNDLPVYDNTYVLYNYNYGRGQNEAVHNHGHQLEAILAEVANRQDGNADLFWRYFVGQNAAHQFVTGRCGWTHMPPNTTADYDYENPTQVWSDIEDWRPDGGGQQKRVSAATWGGLTYPWPEDPAGIGGLTESQFYIYWMQAMPGYLNGIPHAGGSMTNWWCFTGEWDAAIHGGIGLYQVGADVPAGLASRLDFARPVPNPSRGPVRLRFSLPVEGHIRLEVLDVAGRRVASLIDGPLSAGVHSAEWNPGASTDHDAAPGLYFARLSTTQGERMQRIVMLR